METSYLHNYNSTEQALPETVSRFPEGPGVYIMKNSLGVPIYIGKASNLRARVRSYFSDSHDTRPNIPVMMRKVSKIEWIATNTETEALILEANLIRKHKPRYNIDLRDDKHYPYLKVTVQEPFPQLLVVRRVEHDGARYFGPYTDVTAMRRLANFSKKIFRIRDCKRQITQSSGCRACINLAMHRCSAPCSGAVSMEAYRQQVEQLLRFLDGRRTDLIRELTEQMERASSELKFEQAACFRDQIRLIKDSSVRQQVDLKLDKIDCDVFGIAEGEKSVCFAVLQVREGLLLNSHHFLYSKTEWDQANPSRDNLFLQFYLQRGDEPPPTILLPDNRAFSYSVLQQWMEEQFKRKIQITVPQKGDRRLLVGMAEKNAQLYLKQNTVADYSEDAAGLQLALRLPVYPETIEAFDISNTGTAFAVAGMVRFTQGKPDKSAYRRYKIRTVEGQNDFAMMMEVVHRRFERLSKENKPFPDLLLIDGGLGQLHAAQKALQPFKQKIHIVAIAKKEELLYADHLDEPVKLPAAHPGRKLLERIRDEVHRYAISYHRSVRGKQFSSSILETITGVGKKRARMLLKKFGSLNRIKEASVEEISRLPGINENIALKIKETVCRNMWHFTENEI